jgi:hypothetical protein
MYFDDCSPSSILVVAIFEALNLRFAPRAGVITVRMITKFKLLDD